MTTNIILNTGVSQPFMIVNKPQTTILNTRSPAQAVTLNVTSNSTTPSSTPKQLTLVTPNSNSTTSTPKQLTLVTPNSTPSSLGPSSSDYKQYDQRTHVYMKAGMYIVSDARWAREEWLYDMANQVMVNTTIDFVPGCERLFVEIVSNASDNVGRSRRAGVDPGRIDIVMNETTISVTNYGLPIPVEIHPTEKIYTPQMIFGSLLTSSNYEIDRHEAGTNGIGAKAVNIYSTEFMVIVHDHIRHWKYTQVWSNNMIDRSEPVIVPYDGKVSSVQIVYTMDFKRFGYPGQYPPEAFSLFARHAIDLSFTAKIPVSFNGQEFNFSNIRDYARLYFGDAVNSAIVHYQWPQGTEVITKKKGYQVAKNPAIVPITELIAIDTPDDGHHVSFVNCIMTKNGGVHVNSAIKAVGDTAVQMINDTTIKKLTKKNKGKELDAKVKRANTINITDVKPHLSVLLSVRLVNPDFESQSKRELMSPTPKIVVSEEELKPIHRWKLIERLYLALEAKLIGNMSKSDGKLKRHLPPGKETDANQAAKADRHKCVLHITEGRSGATYDDTLVATIPNGRDYIGTLPMRGKVLNVMGKRLIDEAKENKELAKLKEMLGLVEGADYLDQKNFNKLRYGALLIMTDSDVDGKHITGLILNFFHCRFPSLLARGFVMFYRSPILRVWRTKTSPIKFYTEREYNEWKAVTPNHSEWTHKYYKGLGTSSDKEIEDDIATSRVVTCVYDDATPAAMRLAFDKKMANQRKEWIRQWQPLIGADEIQMQPISVFINHELILFSIADIQRSIPSLIDGFKVSHRKIIFGANKEWKIKAVKRKEYKEVKVLQLAICVAKESNYHHGELNLDDVIVGLAQDFVGSNNVPWFVKSGQFGSRYDGGKASESRYTHTEPEKLFGYIIRREDNPILEYLEDEGKKIEPKHYYPIIPMALINGARGIGTGHSTYIPNHNPLDICSWIRQRLQGVEDKYLPDLLPWYRGYNGTIKVIDRRKRKKRGTKIIIPTNAEGATSNATNTTEETTATDIDDEEDEYFEGDEIFEDPEMGDSRPLLSMVTFGKFHKDFNGTIIVTELPIGRYAKGYYNWLKKLAVEKKIADFRNLSGGNKIYFEIYGFTEPANYRSLGLKRTMGMSNMVLLDENGKPLRYDTANDLIEGFYVRRLPIYQRRKNHIIQQLTDEITVLNHKIRFIRAVINKEVRIINRKKADIYTALDTLEIPREIYTKSMITHLSQDDIANLTHLVETKESQRTEAENTSPEQMWLRDIDEFENAYRQVYGIKKQGLTLNIKSDNVIPKILPKRQPAKPIQLNLNNPNVKSLNVTPQSTVLNVTPQSTVLNVTPQSTVLNVTPQSSTNAAVTKLNII